MLFKFFSFPACLHRALRPKWDIRQSSKDSVDPFSARTDTTGRHATANMLIKQHLHQVLLTNIFICKANNNHVNSGELQQWVTPSDAVASERNTYVLPHFIGASWDVPQQCYFWSAQIGNSNNKGAILSLVDVRQQRQAHSTRALYLLKAQSFTQLKVNFN